ncbi:hypothetical protein SAMN04489760_11055 [Syntrophus gentianae]|uniref:Uncharacterized protein n=1 Tax=Syntrophus gentianae TaxID=43775 RepID=A0A1H7XDR7_9BACT|nr:hypothetical protein SAMN04489760_11055 [Syntrophus gentianae]
MLIYWLKTVGIGCASLLFLFLGIDDLMNAYSLTNPHMFIVYFFSSNLMILISLSGLLFSFFRIFTFIKNKRLKPL